MTGLLGGALPLPADKGLNQLVEDGDLGAAEDVRSIEALGGLQNGAFKVGEGDDLP